MKQTWLMGMVPAVVALTMLLAQGTRTPLQAQEEAIGAGGRPEAAAEVAAAAAQPAAAPSAESGTKRAEAPKRPGFISIVVSSGFTGVLLWLALLVALFVGIYFVVDGILLLRVSRVMPPTLLVKVREAMSQGDVAAALEHCKNEPCPMANILTAGFMHVEEGFDVIQEAIGIAADFESEQMMQRIQYLTLVASISPMLGLLGTVQGMIYAFFTLAIAGGGAAQTGLLALNIGQALYTTAAGLSITIPTMSVYHILRNKANKIILRMQAHTMELIKDLRNVEVVSE
jgi:biopolymer transport protein ExbB